MIHLPILARDYTLPMQNFCGLENNQKVLAEKFLLNHSTSATFFVEKAITEGVFFGYINGLGGILREASRVFSNIQTTLAFTYLLIIVAAVV